MSKVHETVYPIIGTAQDIKGLGLSKRELFAAMILQGFASSEENTRGCYDLASAAVTQADALIEILNTPEP